MFTNRRQSRWFALLLIISLSFSMEWSCAPALPQHEPSHEVTTEPRTESIRVREPAQEKHKEAEAAQTEAQHEHTTPEPLVEKDIETSRPDAGEPFVEKAPDNTTTQPMCDLTNPQNDPYQPGVAYFGRNRYIKYIAGSLPIILSAPHGGSLKPSEIKSRTTGALGGDTYSREYTYEVARRLYQLTGRLPHIIINRLHRSKLDANREIVEASQGDKNSETAWGEFKDYILAAKKWVTKRCKQGHYFDLHTNAHSEKWMELGYLLYSSQLALKNSTLDTGTTYLNKTSVKTLASQQGHTLSTLLRGPESLGALMQIRGYKTVPSPKYPDPNGGGYFSGGYNTARYGSKGGGVIDGTQIETHLSMIQNSTRYNYSRALAESILTFVERWYGFRLRNPIQTVPHSACLNAKVLTFQQGEVTLNDDTWGALAQYPGKITCGTSSKLNGPQVYYTFSVQSGKQYDITIKPDFPARVYLFAGGCDINDLNAGCKASKIDGILAVTDVEKTMTYTATKTTSVRLAVGSLLLHWLGSFTLTIRER